MVSAAPTLSLLLPPPTTRNRRNSYSRGSTRPAQLPHPSLFNTPSDLHLPVLVTMLHARCMPATAAVIAPSHHHYGRLYSWRTPGPRSWPLVLLLLLQIINNERTLLRCRSTAMRQHFRHTPPGHVRTRDSCSPIDHPNAIGSNDQTTGRRMWRRTTRAGRKRWRKSSTYVIVSATGDGIVGTAWSGLPTTVSDECGARVFFRPPSPQAAV